MYQDYTATVQRDIARALYGYLGNEYPLPTLNEMREPESKPKEDERTGREIVDGLIKKLTQ